MEMQSFGSWPFVLFVNAIYFSCFTELFLMTLISFWSRGPQVQSLHLTLVGPAENVMAGVTCGSGGRIELKVNILQL